jgi:hypothetical protein
MADQPQDPTAPDAPAPDTDSPDASAPEEVTAEPTGEPIEDADSLDLDRLDAILRDPNVPGDVRAFASTLYAVRTYLSTIEFRTDDAGLVTVHHRDA